MTTQRVLSASRRDPISTASQRALRRAVSLLAVSALLLGPAVEAEGSSLEGGATFGATFTAPQVREAEFSLGIESTLPAALLEPPARPAALASADAARFPGIPRLGVPEIRALAAIRNQQAQEPSNEPAERKSGGLGRWLKRHWWVPVLVAAAAGVAIADSGGDDDKGGEDD